MSIKTATVPAAGESININVTGFSVVILSAPFFSGGDQTPLLSFNSAGDDKPILPGAVYNHNKDQFQRIVITGTAESAGAVIELYISNDCLDEKIPIELNQIRLADPGATFSQVVNDDVSQIEQVDLIFNGRLPKAVYISALLNDVIYTFNADPVQGETGHVLKVNDEPVRIEGINWILSARFRAETGAAAGRIVITGEY